MDLEQLIAQARRDIEAGANPADVDVWIAQTANDPRVRSLQQAEMVLAGERRGPMGVGFPLLRGMSFGLGDEILGALGMATGRPYRQTRDAIRRMTDEAAAAYPKSSMAAELVGGMAIPGLGAAGAMKSGAPLMRTAWQGAKAGTAAGAASGYGYSEEEGAGSLVDAAQGAGTGFAAGGASGLLLQPVLKVFGGAKNLWTRLNDPDKARADAAQRLFLEVMQEAGHDPESAMRSLQQLSQYSPEAVLADVSPRFGRQLRSSLDVAPQLEDPARRFFAERAGGRNDRLAGAIERGMGITQDAAAETAEATAAALPSLGRRLYSPFEGTRFDTPGLRAALQQPEIQSVFARHAPSEAQPGPIFESLQQTVRDMRGRASAAKVSGNGFEARLWNKRADDVLAAMDEAGEDVAAANRQYRTGATVVSSFEQGADAWQKPFREVVREAHDLQRLGGTEALDGYRMGYLEAAARRLRTLQENQSAAAVYGAVGKERGRILKLLFPDPAELEWFLQTAQNEMRMAGTERMALQGSNTAQRVADMGADAAGDIAMGGATGGIGGAAIAGLRRAGDALAGPVRRGAAADVGQGLMMGNDDNLANLMRVLSVRNARQGRSNDLLTRFASMGLPLFAGGQAGRF